MLSMKMTLMQYFADSFLIPVILSQPSLHPLELICWFRDQNCEILKIGPLT